MPQGSFRGPSLDDIEVFELPLGLGGQADAVDGGLSTSSAAVTSRASDAKERVQGAGDAAEEQDAAASSVFEGEGLQQVTTSRSNAQGDEDEEFDYAFSGGKREGARHQQMQIRHSGLPPHLVTAVSGAALGTVSESEDEGEDDEDDQEQQQQLQQRRQDFQEAGGSSAGAGGRSRSRLSQQSHGTEDDTSTSAGGTATSAAQSAAAAAAAASATAASATAAAAVDPLATQQPTAQRPTPPAPSTSSPAPSPRHSAHQQRISEIAALHHEPTSSLSQEQLMMLLPEALQAPRQPSAIPAAVGDTSTATAFDIPAMPARSTQQAGSVSVASCDTAGGHPHTSSISDDELELDDLQLEVAALEAPATAAAAAAATAATAANTPTAAAAQLLQRPCIPATGQPEPAVLLPGPLALRALSDKVVAAHAPSPLGGDPLIGTGADGMVVAAGLIGGGSGAVPSEDEWEVASKLRLQEMEKKASMRSTSNASCGPLCLDTTPPLTYSEARAYFEAADISMYRASILQSLPHEHRGPLTWLLGSGFRGWLCHGTAPNGVLREERVRLLAFAKMGLDGDVAAHVGLLQGVYTSLTGKPGPVPRFGSHWGDVGFQGDDPATDLRSCGMLGLLQLLYLAHHDADMARKMYELSCSVEQEFPLAIVSLNITRWTLCALRQGLLTAEGRRRGSMLDAANAFYVGAFYAFYHRWRNGHLTMRQSGFVLKQLEEASLKLPAAMVKLADHPSNEAPKLPKAFL